MSLMVLSAALVVACNNHATTEYYAVSCPALRPEMCAMNYQPVCASLATGEKKTYSNACSACSDDKVDGYTVLGCSQDKGANKIIEKRRF